MRTKDLCWQRGQILYPQHPPRMNSLLKKILRNFSAAYTLKRFSLRTHPELRPVVMPQVKSRMTIFHTAVMVFPLVLMQAMEAKQLPPSATSLVVECPRTSKFYLLPKIHKPGNPGRPTVSACACPTEKLALYLDKVTAPFVRGLESYVKDTTHMLNIIDSFRFSNDGGAAFGVQNGHQITVYSHYQR
ncbi:unnamed protein product [Porites lobata]|uniref:Uncharacterized protein n=1 Tax=Porites lobata TaxID=104759 RepID=A0ABN8PEB2_9CNID|nr:unnamed protein product [Porites lobata]